MPKVGKAAATPATDRPQRLMATHAAFEEAAARLERVKRTIEKSPRGVDQHVVVGVHGGVTKSLLRWPVAYEHGRSR